METEIHSQVEVWKGHEAWLEQGISSHEGSNQEGELKMEKIMILEKKKYYGKMYSPNKLPKGYTIKGNPAFSDFFLMHNKKPVSRLLFIKNKQTGNKWYNYTLSKKETPKQALLNEKKSERYLEKVRKVS